MKLNYTSLIFLIFHLTPLSAKSQLVNIESQRIQTDSIRFAGNFTTAYNYQETNNIPLAILKSALIFQGKSKSLKHIFLLLGSYDLSKSGQLKLSNAGFGHFRYNYKINKTIRWELYNQLQFNELLSLKYRYIIGTGARIKLNKDQVFKMYIGVSAFYEYEQIRDAQKTINQNARFSNYFVLNIRLPKERGEIISTTYYQPLIAKFNDYRISSQTTLALNITKKLSFTSSFMYFFDQLPPDDVDKKMIQFENGIRLTF